MQRYSGIVQSVEQWTVNPYVTGSSPVARATISAVLCGFFYCFLSAICSSKATKKPFFLLIFYTAVTQRYCYTTYFYKKYRRSRNRKPCPVRLLKVSELSLRQTDNASVHLVLKKIKICCLAYQYYTRLTLNVDFFINILAVGQSSIFLL